MKPLLKVLFILAACFASTFLILKMSGVLTAEQIESWLNQARALSPFYVGTLVALLLFADLFIAVPTLTIAILSGYFLGHTYGTFAALCGVIPAGICGYILGRYYGDRILRFLIKEEDKCNEAIAAFQQHGFVMILLSRAVPILSETTACLAGMTRMNPGKFLLAWLINSVPYMLIAVYAGSVSSIENPKPAIFTAIGLSLLLWLAWYIYHRISKKTIIKKIS